MEVKWHECQRRAIISQVPGDVSLVDELIAERREEARIEAKA